MRRRSGRLKTFYDSEATKFFTKDILRDISNFYDDEIYETDIMNITKTIILYFIRQRYENMQEVE